jgi:hypothetical protein
MATQYDPPTPPSDEDAPAEETSWQEVEQGVQDYLTSADDVNDDDK